MKRSALDRLVSWIGLALAAVLLLAGGLLAFASSFVSGQVADQLSAQKITMPVEAAFKSLPQADQDALRPFAGQPLTTGAQAKAFADHYIQAHMNAAGGGRTYEEVSGEYIALSKDTAADPAKVKELGDLRQTLFMGNTLRSMLLTAYAFGTMGTVALIAAVVSFVGAVVLAVLAFLGLRHAKSAEGEVLVTPSA
jgi:ABC-type multidrug transport system fused ATPase/permease subunit